MQYELKFVLECILVRKVVYKWSMATSVQFIRVYKAYKRHMSL